MFPDLKIAVDELRLILAGKLILWASRILAPQDHEETLIILYGVHSIFKSLLKYRNTQRKLQPHLK